MVSAAYVVGCILSVVSGCMLATQSGINSTLGKHAGKSFASVVSFAVGLVALLLFFAVDAGILRNLGPTREGVASVPWWGWVGGVLGAFYVAVVILFAPVLGAATLMATFVCAQLATAVTLDTMGWVGYKRRSLHWARLLGLGLMLCGVALVTYFDGEEVGAAAAAKGQQPPLPSPSLPSSPQDTGAPSNATLTSSGTVSISGIAVADAPAGSPAGLAGTGESGGTGAGSRRRLMGALRALGCVLWGGVGREGDGWRGMRGRVGRRAAGAEARVEVALSGEVSRGDVEGKSGKEGVGGEVVVVELDEQEEGSAARDCVGTRREAGGALTP